MFYCVAQNLCRYIFGIKHHIIDLMIDFISPGSQVVVLLIFHHGVVCDSSRASVCLPGHHQPLRTTDWRAPAVFPSPVRLRCGDGCEETSTTARLRPATNHLQTRGVPRLGGLMVGTGYKKIYVQTMPGE